MLINLTEKIKMIHSVKMSNVKKHIVLQLVFYFLSFYITCAACKQSKGAFVVEFCKPQFFHNLLNEPLKKMFSNRERYIIKSQILTRANKKNLPGQLLFLLFERFINYTLYVGVSWNCHDAVQDFRRATELNPNFSDAYYNRGVVEAELGNYHGARQDYAAAASF
jgi:tetratricopeptide (TPR) repeat protein